MHYALKKTMQASIIWIEIITTTESVIDFHVFFVCQFEANIKHKMGILLLMKNLYLHYVSYGSEEPTQDIYLSSNTAAITITSIVDSHLFFFT